MMKTVLYVTFLAAFIATGTPLKCYVCEDCYDVSNINETECDVSKPNCQTSYRNETGDVKNVSRVCTSEAAKDCFELKADNVTLTLCVCDTDACNDMDFPVPTTIATTTAGIDRHCATALSTIIAVAVTGFFSNLF